MNKITDEWKMVLLSRWMGEFPAADESETKPVLKTSQEIADDLREFGDFEPEEISAVLAANGYPIIFDGNLPKWRIKYSIKIKEYEQLPE